MKGKKNSDFMKRFTAMDKKEDAMDVKKKTKKVKKKK